MKKNETSRHDSRQVILILDNVRSVLNVGAIFRTADAFGISEIYLCGVTPTPIDRFGRKRNDLHKTALGAEDSVKWKYFQNTLEIVSKLKENGFEIFSLEQDPKSTDYKNLRLRSGQVVIVFGSETYGVDKEILKISDQIAEIKMLGKKESLNVSVSAGILLARILNI